MPPSLFDVIIISQQIYNVNTFVIKNYVNKKFGSFLYQISISTN